MPILTIYYFSFLLVLTGLLAITGIRAQRSPAATQSAMGLGDGQAPTPAHAVAATTTSSAGPPPPEASASFYDNSPKDLGPSLAWMRESNSVSPTYWNLYTESRILLKMSDYTGARTTAEQAYQLAIKAMPASKEYVMLSACIVAQAHSLANQ